MRRSALWRHAHTPWRLAVYGAGVALGFTPWWPVGLMALWGAALGELAMMGVEAGAKRAARRRGYRVLFVLPCPPRWAARRLRALGYAGPVAHRLWEMHVMDDRRWPAPNADEAVRAFRQAYTAERLRWLDARPAGVGVIFTTYNRLPTEEVAALQDRGAWRAAGALHPRIARAAHRRRVRVAQQRLFGRVVSTRDRTDPATWTTVYVPPLEGPSRAGPAVPPAPER